jgi:hypothetical protein
MHAPRKLLAAVLFMTLAAFAAPAWAQKSYDDHELTDRFSISIGGFSQSDIRTTLRLDADSPLGGLAIGTVIGLESLFDVEDQVTTGRLDGWYRFGKKNRINFTYWRTDREGVATYTDSQPIEIGDITINPGDDVITEDKSQFIAVSWTYSFLNTRKYEAWLGIGLNFQTLETTINANLGGGMLMAQEEAKATIPIPTMEFGGRWNFSKRTRMLLNQQVFGIKIGDFEGRLNNTRILVEYNIVKNFSIGGGFERFNFEVDGEGEDFSGSFDTSYSGLSLYIKGLL